MTMTREERMERARGLFHERKSLTGIAEALARETAYTFDQCYEHLVSAVVKETEKLLGGAR